MPHTYDGMATGLRGASSENGCIRACVGSLWAIIGLQKVAADMLTRAWYGGACRLGISVEVLDSRNATGYYNVLNDEGRSVVGALLVMDPAARVPESMPEIKEPLWDRPGVLQQGGRM